MPKLNPEEIEEIPDDFNPMNALPPLERTAEYLYWGVLVQHELLRDMHKWIPDELPVPTELLPDVTFSTKKTLIREAEVSFEHGLCALAALGNLSSSPSPADISVLAQMPREAFREWFDRTHRGLCRSAAGTARHADNIPMGD